ncbi:50S ribosomal protein L25 [Pajaroellobacter abortibovis]|uniref:Large ribosomal subunit protein bL25 n=1 Tax=Pajaroellobacter abortibovis TaxID=1882918 RepID=A0A1L6MXU8_9BACT|nr:50S ribosomal protein L25 [Pajaroellobacter abortibovis]APS00312.1 hypothetical protein BCY86_06185 [Pajaroellobacter abortibovis]
MNSTVARLSDSIISLPVMLRSTKGKEHARRLRAQQQIPAIAYGKGLSPTCLAVSPKDMLHILKSERGMNTVIRLLLEGAEELIVMIRDYSYHPVSRMLEHVDFVQVRLDEPVDVELPLIPVGKAYGVTMGGVVHQVYRYLPARCFPAQIPPCLHVDISALNLNEHISTKDLELEGDIMIRLPADQTIIAIIPPTRNQVGEFEVPGAPAGEVAAKGGESKDSKAVVAKEKKK